MCAIMGLRDKPRRLVKLRLSRLGRLEIRQPHLVQHAFEHSGFVSRQVALCLLLQDCQRVDRVLGEVEVHLGLAGHRIRHLTERDARLRRERGDDQGEGGGREFWSWGHSWGGNVVYLEGVLRLYAG